MVLHYKRHDRSKYTNVILYDYEASKLVAYGQVARLGAFKRSNCGLTATILIGNSSTENICIKDACKLFNLAVVLEFIQLRDLTDPRSIVCVPWLRHASTMAGARASRDVFELRWSSRSVISYLSKMLHFPIFRLKSSSSFVSLHNHRSTWYQEPKCRHGNRNRYSTTAQALEESM